MNQNKFTSNRSTFRFTWQTLLFGLGMFALGAIVGGFASVFLFLQITGGSATISEPISAPTLSVAQFQSNQPEQVEAVETVQVEQLIPTVALTEMVPTTEVAVISTEIPPTPTLLPSPTLAPSPTVAPLPTATIPLPQLFRIEADRSQARFSVYETFPEGTAIGATNQIAGDIIIDFETPANSQIGIIRINLRSLQTDDPKRDQSIRCCVLLTGRDEYEFGEFKPTSISPLPAQVTFDQPIPIQITGDLTVRGVTNPVTFDVTLRLPDATELHGLATAQVNRYDFGILNNTDNGFDYHGVADEITLEFEFVARIVPPEEATSD